MEFNELDKVEEEYGIGKGSGDWFNFKDGLNKIRIVTLFEVFAQHWDNTIKKSIACVGKENGCVYCNDMSLEEKKRKPRPQWIGWVIDRTDGELKLLKTGYSVIKQVSELANSDDYKFGKDGLPLYDITVKKSGEGLQTEYSVIADRKDSKLTDIEKEKIESLKHPLQIIVAMKEKSEKGERKEGEIPNAPVFNEESGEITDEEIQGI